MRIPKPILAIILAVEFIVGMSSFGFIMDLTNDNNSGIDMGIFGIWCVLFAAAIFPVFSRLIED